MKPKIASINSKIIFPLVGGFALLLVLFLLLVVKLQREKTFALRNITSTQRFISFADNLSDLENQADFMVMAYKVGDNKDTDILQLISRSDNDRLSAIAQVSENIYTQRGQELLQNYIVGVKDATAYRQELIAAIQASSPEQVDNTYAKWKAKRDSVNAALSGIIVYGNTLLNQDIAAFRKTITEVMVACGFILLVMALLTVAFYLYLKKKIIRPINCLIAGTKLVSDENLDWKVKINSFDEIGELAQAFNEMTGKLKNSYTNLKALAFQDPLTNLPNRQALEDRLKGFIKLADEHRHMVGVMLLDLDRFKKINDTLGHDVGDSVLKEVAERLLAVLRPEDAVIRLGGDEFVVLFSGITSVHDASAVADKILKSLEEVMVLGGKQMYISGSIGISLYPNDGDNLTILLKNADIALYEAKAGGRNRYNFYNKITDLRPTAQLELENDLHRAIKEDQLKVFFQPIINIASGKVVAAEALLRWQHPTLGMLMPHEFIHLAEEIGMIHYLGEWVLKTACQKVLDFQEISGGQAFQIAVNLSPRQFLEANLVEDISGLLDETKMPAERLILEITENLAMANLEQGKAKLKKLSAMGIAISIDDFGIGYSSLSSIKDFAANRIKIDSSFIRHIITDPQDTAIVKAIITMGHNLNLLVAAEGVETDTQLALLKSLGCDEVQGYFVGRPLSGEDFQTWFAARLEAEPPVQGLPQLKGNMPEAPVVLSEAEEDKIPK